MRGVCQPAGDCHKLLPFVNPAVMLATINDLASSLPLPPWALALIGVCVTVLTFLAKAAPGLKVLSDASSGIRTLAGRVRARGSAKGRRLESRRRFTDWLEGRLRQLNDKEQWSDHRFAELEVEVETR